MCSSLLLNLITARKYMKIDVDKVKSSFSMCNSRSYIIAQWINVIMWPIISKKKNRGNSKKTIQRN